MMFRFRRRSGPLSVGDEAESYLLERWFRRLLMPPAPQSRAGREATKRRMLAAYEDSADRVDE